MKPILYESNETTFNHNGLGTLNECLSSETEEVANGEYVNETIYRADGRLAKKIDYNRLLKIKPNDQDDFHIFEIYDYELDAVSNILTIYSHTVTNRLAGNFVKKVTVNNVPLQSALNTMRSNLMEPTPFDFVTDISTRSSTAWENRNPLKCIAGEQGSVIQIWGGEIKHDHRTVYVYRRRGRDNAGVIREGKHIRGLNINYSLKGLVTKIVPFRRYTPEGKEEEIVEYGTPVESEYINHYPHAYIVEKDYSFDDDVTDLTSMNAKASRYFEEADDIDKPRVNVTLDMLELSRTNLFKEEFKHFETIGLFDEVTVYSRRYNIELTAKVRRVVYDSLRERNIVVEVGNFRTGLMEQTQRNYEDLISEREASIRQVIQRTADGKNRIYRGVDEPASGMSKNDLWYQPVGAGETMLYRFDGTHWQLEKVSAGLLGGTLDAENGDVNLINLNASSIVTGTLNALDVDVINLTADNIITGVLRSHNGNFSLDMDTGIVNMLDGNFEGRINADDGMVGGWRINSDVLYGELASGAFTSLKATGEVALAVNVLDPRVTSDARLQILHDGSIRFKSRSGGASTSTEIGRFERSGDYDFLIRGSRVLNLEAVAHVRVDANMRPNNNSRLLGSDSFRWYEIYVGGTGINQSSDARLKDDIKNVPEELLAGFLELEPKSYTIDGRQHFGYIAQDVERVMYKYGVEKYGFDNVADFMSSLNIVKKNESYLSLSYGQVEALKSAACKKEIDKLRQRLDEMEGGANE